MRTITVNKDELLEALTKNQRTHLREYLQAMDGFRTAMHDAYCAATTDLEVSGKAKQNFHDIEKPESHDDDYSLVIAMLEYHEGSTIELSENDFKQCIQDDWSWQPNFKTLHSRYTQD